MSTMVIIRDNDGMAILGVHAHTPPVLCVLYWQVVMHVHTYVLLYIIIGACAFMSLSCIKHLYLTSAQCSNAIVPAVEVEFAGSEKVQAHESQAAFYVCLVKHGENSCPVTALVNTCSGSPDLPAATGEERCA